MTVRADLDALRVMTGQKTTTDDRVLSQCLEAAGAWIYDRVRPSSHGVPEVVQAVLMLAARLYKRRLSPEGVAGWEDMGAVRVVARDPDIDRLIEQHIDAYNVWGVA
jgi:hypothetical protein